jgi:hypothetical protein
LHGIRYLRQLIFVSTKRVWIVERILIKENNPISWKNRKKNHMYRWSVGLI